MEEQSYVWQSAVQCMPEACMDFSRHHSNCVIISECTRLTIDVVSAMPHLSLDTIMQQVAS